MASNDNEASPPQRFWPNSDETVQLLSLVRSGDEQARGQLLDRHRGSLRRIIEMRLDRRVVQRVDASDVVQNVMLTANRRLSEYLNNPEVPFFLWLRQLAKDGIIDEHRRHRKAQKRSVDQEQPIRLPAGDNSSYDLMSILKDGNVTPAAAATMNEFRDCLEEAIIQLNEIDREIVLMRHYEFLANKEVAQSLGLTEHAASMRYVRALRRLGNLLRSTGHVDDPEE